MTARRLALVYAALAAGMVAVGALGAVGIVALEERSNKRLGDGQPDTEWARTTPRPDSDASRTPGAPR